MASRADVWYNEVRKIVRRDDVGRTARHRYICTGDASMDILSSEIVNYKLCANCHIPKPESKFHRNQEWCRKCLRAARLSVPEGMKLCTLCKEVKELAQFSAEMIYGKTRVPSWCKACESKRAKEYNHRVYDPLLTRHRYLQQKHGITLAEYEAMLIAQGGLCASCRHEETAIHHRTKNLYPLVVDHDHKTGKIRGLLCVACNQSLGLLEEDPERIQALLNYLLEHLAQ